MTVTNRFYFFLRSPQPPRDAASAYHEVQSFGPWVDSGTPRFSEFTEIDILSVAPEDEEVRAVCDGLLQAIVTGPFDPLATTIMLHLTPSITAWQDLNRIMGDHVETPTAFLYDNIDMNWLDAVLTPLINAAPNPENISLADRIRLFKEGQYAVMVRGGDTIGKASDQGTDPGKLRLYFAVATSWATRIDPAAFYALLAVYAGAGAPVIASVDQSNNLLSAGVLSSRVLVEIRTEYNTPYAGPVTIRDGSGTMVNPTIDAGNQGFVEVPDGWAQYQVSLAGRRQTSIPDGDNGYEEVSRNLTAPAQWTVQTINLDDWFAVQDPWPDDAHADLRLPRWTGNNKVEFLIDGIAAYDKMVDAINTVNSASHFIHLAAWWLTQDMEMIPGAAGNSMLAIASRVSPSNASVRILEWGVNATLSEGPVSPLGVMSATSGSIHYISDNRTRSYPLGAHHQKMMIVQGSNGTIAFCGGIDINPNRLDTPDHKINDPYHDAHSQVEGPAVWDLAKIFRQRYNEITYLGVGAAADQIPTGNPPLTPTSGSHFVQVARTYPNGVGYSFAPTGDRTIRATMLRAIARATRCIYIEDQYLVSMDISSAILGVLSKIEHVIIVINADTDLPQDNYRRREFIRPLKTAFPGKVHVFTLRKGNKEIYCHAKVLIVDDIFASIGSANINRRGLTHDSECNVFVIDGRVEGGVRKFAADLRIALWSEHLGLRGASGRMALADPTAAATLALWTRSSPSNRAVPYDENANIETPGSPVPLPPPWNVIAAGADAVTWNAQWDQFYDPDGSMP